MNCRNSILLPFVIAMSAGASGCFPVKAPAGKTQASAVKASVSAAAAACSDTTLNKCMDNQSAMQNMGSSNFEAVTIQEGVAFALSSVANSCLTIDGTSSVQKPCSDSGSQVFTVKKLPDDPLVFEMHFGDRCLDLFNSDSKDGADIARWDCNSSQPQQWQPITNSDGTYSFESKQAPGKCFDVQSETSSKLRLWTCNQTAAQKFTLIAEKDLPDSTKQMDTAPDTWNEHWGEHVQTLTRVYMDNDIVVYFDKDILDVQKASWLFPYVKKVWLYTKAHFGDFDNGRLYAVFHAKKYGGGHPSTHFDASHDYRNVIDIGADNWEDPNSNWALEVIIHEIGHIVEGAAFNVASSPAFGLWGDSKWCEIYVYDVLNALSLQKYADDLANRSINGSGDNFPKMPTYWMRDWFLPIYREKGGIEALVGYFKVLSANFPQMNHTYTRGMNMGEFVHIFGGVTGRDMKDTATKTFGWSTDWDNQYQKARQEMPGIKY